MVVFWIVQSAFQTQIFPAFLPNKFNGKFNRIKNFQTISLVFWIFPLIVDLLETRISKKKVPEDEVFHYLFVKKLFSCNYESEQSAKSCQSPDPVFGCTEVIFSGFLYCFSTVAYKDKCRWYSRYSFFNTTNLYAKLSSVCSSINQVIN